MSAARRTATPVAIGCVVVVTGCTPEPVALGPTPPRAMTTGTPDGAPAWSAGAGTRAPPATPDPPAPAPPPAPAACPPDMVFVDTLHCERATLRCLKEEYEKSNHLHICHRFAAGQACSGPARRQRFCIDPYEYPNEPGAHPPVLVSAFDAAALCAERGKRLCWESEWTAACEGPDKLPFPYGLSRSAGACNIDNPYIPPSLARAHSGHAATQDAELRRLDQSVPSGSMEGCRSGFGVYDLTGNFDEWVLTERRRGRSGWAGLKGGAWGHVRNACRPVTTSHVPAFIYYFISFRCCRDPDAAAIAATGDGASVALDFVPPPLPAVPSRFSRGWVPR